MQVLTEVPSNGDHGHRRRLPALDIEAPLRHTPGDAGDAGVPDVPLDCVQPTQKQTG